MVSERRPRSARTVGGERLVLSYFSLAPDHPLDDRIRAAGAAGFHGIGLYAGRYQQLRDDGLTDAHIHDLLDDAGVVISEVEVLSGWAASEPTAAYSAFEETVWHLVDEFDVPYVQAIGPVDRPFAEAAVRFGELCDRAAPHGATIGLEFLPFTDVVDAADALEIVAGADRPNGGVCIDVWHHARGADDLALLDAIPSESIVAVQMNDGPLVPVIADYKLDCLRTRVPPGSGTFDLDAVVGLLLDKGVDVAWDLEVCNERAWGESNADRHAHACADAMRDVLARHLPSS